MLRARPQRRLWLVLLACTVAVCAILAIAYLSMGVRFDGALVFIDTYSSRCSSRSTSSCLRSSTSLTPHWTVAEGAVVGHRSSNKRIKLARRSAGADIR